MRNTPQYLTSRVPSMCWTPAIIPTQSRVRCTIYVNIIDCVWSVLSQNKSYSSTFKFCLLKTQEICPLKRIILPVNAPKYVWWPGSARTCPDPLGELTTLPKAPSWLRGEVRGTEERGRGGRERGNREGKEGKGRTPTNV